MRQIAERAAADLSEAENTRAILKRMHRTVRVSKAALLLRASFCGTSRKAPPRARHARKSIHGQ
jgi:hypothetical protein